MRHPDNKKMLCLCGDGTSPWNAACHHTRQGKQECLVLIYRYILLEIIYFSSINIVLALNTSQTIKWAVQDIIFEKVAETLLVGIHPSFYEVVTFIL
jgi:hypothetical protein